MNDAFNEDFTRRLRWSLLLLRLGVGVVFLMWTIDKFRNPEHAAAVFEKFYKFPSLSSTLAYVLGTLQAVVVLAFMAGAFKNISYLIIFALHFVSTISTYAKYAEPWTYPNLLFFAAFPMLAACATLWLLRRHDTLLSVDANRASKASTG